jgi:glycosyltransferase 2 family protein
MPVDHAEKRRARLKVALRIGALVIALGFMVALVSTQWQALQAFQWQVRPAWLALSLLGLWLAWLLELSVWRFLLSTLGGNLRWGRAAETWFLSNIVRYIPGNIWQFLGMAELAADDGVSRVTTFTSIALHQALSTAVGIVLAAVYFAVAGKGALLDTIRPFLWLIPLGLLLCNPRFLEWSLNTLLRLFKRPPIKVTLTWTQLGLILLGYLGVWLIMGSAFALLAASITPVTPQQFAALIATWAAAYVIGYLSMITPSGLGVREGVMILLLAPLFPAPIPTIIALAARLWMVIAEVVGATIALIVRTRERGTVKGGEWSPRGRGGESGEEGEASVTPLSGLTKPKEG